MHGVLVVARTVLAQERRELELLRWKFLLSAGVAAFLILMCAAQATM
jgi:hypothetical protein